MDISEFIQKMPKVELHAHLSGCLDKAAILELTKLKYGEIYELEQPDLEFETLQQCCKTFEIIHVLTEQAECLFRAVECALQFFERDNVVYLELRFTPTETIYINKFKYFLTVVQSVQKFQKTSKMIVKLLPSIDRSKGFDHACDNLRLAIHFKNRYPNLIKGIDFSGDPAILKFSTYEEVLEKARENGLKLALHCAEIPNEKEILRMLDFGMDRIGHGTFLKLKDVSNKRIPIECCLTSNLLCATVPSIYQHPFKLLFDAKYPVCICTDDPGLFNTTLSQEISLCAKTFNLTKNDIIQLTKNAIECCFGDTDEKAILNLSLSSFEEKFAK